MAENEEGVKVYLPRECISIHSWRVKEGSSVKKDETIALGLLVPTTDQNKKSDGDVQSILVKNTIETKDPVKLNGVKTNGLNKKTSARSRMLARAKNSKLKQTQNSTILSNTLNIVSPADGFLRILNANDKDGLSLNGKLQRKIIAIVGPCTHPTIIDSLCVVCGLHIGPNNESDNSTINQASRKIIPSSHGYSNSTNSSSLRKTMKQSKTEKFTVSGGITVQVTKSEAQSIGLADQNRLKSLRKLSLVLDLDHTLVHATSDKRGSLESQSREDVRTILLPMEVMREGGLGAGRNNNRKNGLQSFLQTIQMKHYIKLRPNLKAFFSGVQDLYEIGIYTAGTRGYAQQIAHTIARHIAGQPLDDEDIIMMREELKKAELDLHNSRKGHSYDVDNSIIKAKKAKIENAVKKEIVPILKKSIHLTEQKGNVILKENNNDSKMEKLETHDQTTQSQIDIENMNKKDCIGPNNKKNITSNQPSSSLGFNLKDEDETSDSKSAGSIDNQDSLLTEKKNGIINESKKINAVDKKQKMDVMNELSDIDDKIPHKIPRKKKRSVVFADPSQNKIHKHCTPFSNVNLDDDPQFQHYIQGLRKRLKEAEAMESKVLEIRNKIFSNRIISRTDVGDLGRDVKSLKRVFPCGGSMAVIVDDREDVWANAKDDLQVKQPGEPPPNLLLVKPYRWQKFSGYEDVNNTAGVDLTTQPQKSDGDEKKQTSNNIEDNDMNDKQLLWTLDILQRLHRQFYSEDVSIIKKSILTVPSALTQMRRNVFGSGNGNRKAINIVFSGLVPLHHQNRLYDKQRLRPAVERYAEDLGANVFQNISKNVTHVIAARDGTEKVLQGREINGCYITNISWLMECYWSMTRREEKSHLINAVTRKSIIIEEKKKNQSIGKKILLSGSDESESDEMDDDWLDELGNDLVRDSKT